MFAYEVVVKEGRYGVTVHASEVSGSEPLPEGKLKLWQAVELMVKLGCHEWQAIDAIKTAVNAVSNI